MKCGIYTFEIYHGKKDIGSSRIRGHWLAKYWEDAEIMKLGEHYDVVIFQKAYDIEFAKYFKGIKILDLCDPDWMHWQFPIKEMIEECDAITTSTQALADYITTITEKPVMYIADRLDLESLKEKITHRGEFISAVWLSYTQ